MKVINNQLQSVTYEICGEICEFVCDIKRTLFVNNKMRVLLMCSLRYTLVNYFKKPFMEK